MKVPTDSSTLKDPLEDCLTYQLRRAAFATTTPLVESLATLGLSPTEAIVILFVRDNASCNQASIGRAIGVKRANMVPVINMLMTKGLLERNPVDGRSHSLHLTRKGTDAYGKIGKINRELDKTFFGKMPEDMRQLLLQVFLKLRAKGAKRE